MKTATEDELQAAIDAKRFSEDPVCQRVLLRISNNYRKTIENSEFDQRDLREDCYRQLRAIKDFNHELKILANRGAAAVDRKNKGT